MPISTRTAPFRATPASLRRREKGSDDSESDSDSEAEAEATPRGEELVTHNGGCHCGLVKFEVCGAAVGELYRVFCTTWVFCTWQAGGS